MEKALPLILQGKNIRPEQALELGIVHELAPAQEVVERAKHWLLEIGDPLAPWDKKGFKVPGGAGAMTPRNAQTFMVGTSLLVGKTQNNYPAPIAAMSAVYEGCITPIDTGLDIEAQYFGTLLAGPVARNMMRSLFINKGAADKLARRPQGIEKSRVNKLGILGVLASEQQPLCAVSFAEVLHASDVPAGVVNILTGFRSELTEQFASHMDVNAIAYCDGGKKAARTIQELAAENIKHAISRQQVDWLSDDAASPYQIRETQEVKTTWHPIGT